MGVNIACVVEGHGEVRALPVLLRRHLHAADRYDVGITPPHRVTRSRMLGADLARAVRLQSLRVVDGGGVLVLLDADDDDPALIAQQLQQQCDSHAAVRVVVAVREYEAWFLAGLESLRAHPAVRDDAVYHGDPQQPRDAKRRLQGQMLESYKETIHQSALSALLDLDLAQTRSPSLAHLRTAVDELTRQL